MPRAKNIPPSVTKNGGKSKRSIKNPMPTPNQWPDHRAERDRRPAETHDDVGPATAIRMVVKPSTEPDRKINAAGQNHQRHAHGGNAQRGVVTDADWPPRDRRKNPGYISEAVVNSAAKHQHA